MTAFLIRDFIFPLDPFLPFLPPNIPSNSRWAKILRHNLERELRKRQAQLAVETKRTTEGTSSQG